MEYLSVSLLPGREKLAASFHPWIYSGAIAPSSLKAIETTLVADVESGRRALPAAVVRVADAKGRFVAWAQYNGGSKIRLRILSWQEVEYPDTAWLGAKLAAAMARRTQWQGAETTAIRLVYAESDGLPGIIVDRLGAVLVLQLLTHEADTRRFEILDALVREAPKHIPAPFTLEAIIERSDGDGRRLEGLPIQRSVLWGAAPEGPFPVLENGLSFLVDPSSQKTGFYSDQRVNRARVSASAAGARVLDVFSYTGGFAASCARAGARSITLVDSSKEALALAEQNVATAKEGTPIPCESISGDAFEVLRRLVAAGRRFDLVILDPPKLVPKRANLEKGLGAYKDLILQGLQLLDEDGLLAIFSCSGLVTSEALRLQAAYAAHDLGIQVQVLEEYQQAPCHPVPLAFAEARYLKGFLLRKI